MSLQLIICVEADNKSKSDFMYISSTIRWFYKIDSNVRLTPVYMGGKSHYNSRKIRKEIERYIRQYRAMNKNSRNVVLYCFDCDRYDQNSEDQEFLKNARKYCEDNNCYFVWFCRDIEQVFLGKNVKNEKGKEAEHFIRNQMIQKIDRNKLRAEKYGLNQSNLCQILDQFLTVKQK